MTYQDTNFPEVENVGMLDRVNRGIASMTLIVAAVQITMIPSTAVAAMVALGLYTGLTASIGWDPLYALVKAFQQRTPAPTPATITPYPQRGGRSSGGSYKKAA
jgi:hypothetical protein